MNASLSVWLNLKKTKWKGKRMWAINLDDYGMSTSKNKWNTTLFPFFDWKTWITKNLAKRLLALHGGWIFKFNAKPYHCRQQRKCRNVIIVYDRRFSNIYDFRVCVWLTGRRIHGPLDDLKLSIHFQKRFFSISDENSKLCQELEVSKR